MIKFSKKGLPISGRYVAEYHKSRAKFRWCVLIPPIVQIFVLSNFFLPLNALNFQCQFKKWTHFTDPFYLIPPLNNLSTFFINLIFNFFLALFSSYIQIAYLFHKINVYHIKYRYWITKLIFRDVCGTERHFHGSQNVG